MGDGAARLRRRTDRAGRYPRARKRTRKRAGESPELETRNPHSRSQHVQRATTTGWLRSTGCVAGLEAVAEQTARAAAAAGAHHDVVDVPAVGGDPGVGLEAEPQPGRAAPSSCGSSMVTVCHGRLRAGVARRPGASWRRRRSRTRRGRSHSRSRWRRCGRTRGSLRSIHSGRATGEVSDTLRLSA